MIKIIENFLFVFSVGARVQICYWILLINYGRIFYIKILPFNFSWIKSRLQTQKKRKSAILFPNFSFFLPVKPQTVNILTKEKQVSADKRYEVECRTTGSRPEAVITWWKGSRPVKRLAKNVSVIIYFVQSLAEEKNPSVRT